MSGEKEKETRYAARPEYLEECSFIVIVEMLERLPRLKPRIKKYHIEKILRGEKTMTRRLHTRPYRVGHTYRIQRDWYHWTDIYIRITRRFRQRLGNISPEDIRKEGYRTLAEFKGAWIEINDEWDPDQLVWVYEFEKASQTGEETLKEHTKCGWVLMMKRLGL